MLHRLELEGVGPAEELSLELKPRVNLITGDNGLGKTFLLDVAWWVLGRTWAGSYQALPRRGAREAKIGYVVDLASQRIRILPKAYESDDLRRRIVLMLSMNRVQQHLRDAIRFENAECLVPVFDTERPVRSTGDMYPWHTSRPCERARKCHVNFAVFDSTWEASEAFALDESPLVKAWVKNDHLGFEILYTYAGAVRKFRPDYLVQLVNDTMLVLEVKGRDSEEHRVKRRYLDEWVEAINLHGGFGRWAAGVSLDPADVHDVLAQHAPQAGKTG